MASWDNATVAGIHYASYNGRDLERASDVVDENAEWLNVPLGLRYRGREGYRDFISGWVSAFADSRLFIGNQVVSGEYVITEFEGRGTHRGRLRFPMADIPPTGRPVEVKFCEVLQIRNARIIRGRLYYDLMGLMLQLGLTVERAALHLAGVPVL
jgi:predicted ester cyclase